MTKLNTLYFLIHGLCYAEAVYGQPMNSQHRRQSKAYLERESECAEQWRARITKFSESEGLVIIPAATGKGRPADDFNAFAEAALGARCFILDCPDSSQADFWTRGDSEFGQAILNELQGAFAGQNTQCNREEIDTALHCLAIARQLRALLYERGYEFDAASLQSEAWGASFEGCVTKYAITLRHLLGLAKAVEINFGLCVPDASFLLAAPGARCIALKSGLQIFVFQNHEDVIALYACQTHSLSDKPAWARLPPGLAQVVIKSKQNIRLWPNPETYHLPNAPLPYREPAQEVVRLRENRLCVPISSGFVYRLAKAPAYIFAPPAMREENFCALLMQAEIEAA